MQQDNRFIVLLSRLSCRGGNHEKYRGQLRSYTGSHPQCIPQIASNKTRDGKDGLQKYNIIQQTPNKY